MSDPKFRRRTGIKGLACKTYGLWESCARSRFVAGRKSCFGTVNDCLGIFVQAGSDAYPSGLGDFRRLWRAFSALGHSAVIVDNMPTSSLYPNERELCIRGSNTAWEFSAFQEGLDAWMNRGNPLPAWIVCVNSAFTRTKTRLEVERWLNPRVISSIPEGLFGRVWSYSPTSRCIGLPCEHCVQTDAFAIPGSIAKEIGFVAVDENRLLEFSPIDCDGTSLFRSAAPITEDLRKYFDHHLTSRWYNSGPLCGEKYKFLRKKLQAILNEHLLSARCAAAGFPLINPGPVCLFTGIASRVELKRPGV